MNFAAPPPETKQSNVAALVFSATVHLLLIGALFLGVQWKSQAPAPVAVEVWRSASSSSVAEHVSATKPVPTPEPPPTPKIEQKPAQKAEATPTIKPDIAVKDEKKQKKDEVKKIEPKKEEPKKETPKKEEPKKEDLKKEPPKKDEPKKTVSEPRSSFDDELRRDLKQAQQQQKATQGQHTHGEIDAELGQLKASQGSYGRSNGLADWSDKVRGKIRGNIIVPQSVQGNPEAVFGITQLPSGEIIDVKLRKTSGNKALDEAIERAILKSSPLPKPEQAELYQRVFELKVKPLNE